MKNMNAERNTCILNSLQIIHGKYFLTNQHNKNGVSCSFSFYITQFTKLLNKSATTMQSYAVYRKFMYEKTARRGKGAR